MPIPADFFLDYPVPLRGFGSIFAERFRDWRQQRRQIAALAAAGPQFEAMATAEDVDPNGLDPAALCKAIWVCGRCECREPCKRWLREGIWKYDGDPRCPNAALLHH